MSLLIVSVSSLSFIMSAPSHPLRLAVRVIVGLSMLQKISMRCLSLASNRNVAENFQHSSPCHEIRRLLC